MKVMMYSVYRLAAAICLFLVLGLSSPLAQSNWRGNFAVNACSETRGGELRSLNVSADCRDLSWRWVSNTSPEKVIQAPYPSATFLAGGVMFLTPNEALVSGVDGGEGVIYRVVLLDNVTPRRAVFSAPKSYLGRDLMYLHYNTADHRLYAVDQRSSEIVFADWQGSGTPLPSVFSRVIGFQQAKFAAKRGTSHHRPLALLES